MHSYKHFPFRRYCSHTPALATRTGKQQWTCTDTLGQPTLPCITRAAQAMMGRGLKLNDNIGILGGRDWAQIGEQGGT